MKLQPRRKQITQPAILDIEATGFHPLSYPIEIGVITEDGLRYSSLIQPYPNWDYWNEEAEAVHGIRREELLKHGKPGDVVTRELNEILQNRTVYSDGWVVDKPWLIKLFDRARRPMSFWLSPLEMILSEAMMDRWEEAKALALRELQGQRHRASIDALRIQRTYQLARDLAGG